jgi:hypothetical protein
METIGNKTALLFPMCSICFHLSSFWRLKLLLLSYLSLLTDREIVTVSLIVFTFFAKAF